MEYRAATALHKEFPVTIVSVFISTLMSVIVYTLLFAGVHKLFTIAKDLGDIKTLLKDERMRQRSHLTPPVDELDTIRM